MKYKILGILGVGIFVLMFLQVDAMTCQWNNNNTELICDGDVTIGNDSEVICSNLENRTGSSSWIYSEMTSYRDLWKTCIIDDTSVPEDYIPTIEEVKASESYNALESDYQELQSEFDDYTDDAVTQSAYSSCTRSLDECIKDQGSSWQKYLIGFGACFLLLYAANKSPKELLGRGDEPKHDIEEEFGPGRW